MKAILHTLRLLAALLAVGGILIVLFLLYQFWIWWFIPAFVTNPAGMTIACAVVLLVVTLVLWQHSGDDGDYF